MASLARSTLNRAVHLRITPRPSNISESREILRLVSQFGEVEYYKSLKYDTLSHPTASLVIFRDEQAAEQCLKRSPIRFRLGPADADADLEHQSEHAHDPFEQQQEEPQEPQEQQYNSTHATQTTSPAPIKGPLSTPFGMSSSQTRSLSTHSLPSAPRSPPALPFLQPDSELPLEDLSVSKSRIFQLQTNRARVNFRDAIDRTEYHGRFAIDGKSSIQQDLAGRVPAPGLSCWEWRKPYKPERVVLKMRTQEVRRSLKEIWEEGMRPEEVEEEAGKRPERLQELGQNTWRPETRR
jgi:hypothetical protein